MRRSASTAVPATQTPSASRTCGAESGIVLTVAQGPDSRRLARSAPVLRHATELQRVEFAVIGKRVHTSGSRCDDAQSIRGTNRFPPRRGSELGQDRCNMVFDCAG